MIIIAGVVVMAAGAWVMPMYTAQLAHDDAATILSNVKEVKSDVSDTEKALTGGKSLGKQSVVALVSSGKDKSELSSLFGDEFSTFNDAFLGGITKSVTGLSGVEVRSFEAPTFLTLVPDDFNGVPVPEADAGTCAANGVLITDTEANYNDLPIDIQGWILENPGGTLENVRLEVCATAGPLQGPGVGEAIIIDIIDIGAAHKFTKNFDYGIVPPNSALRVFITDDPDSGITYNFWIITGDPESVQSIQAIQGLAGNPCNSITITVQDEGDVNLNANEAFVEVAHEFLPFISGLPVGAGGVAAFPGPLPPGTYFIDIFPNDPNLFPSFTELACAANANAAATIDLEDATVLIADLGAGTLVVTITDQTGTSLTNTRSFVDHSTLPIINDICNDGVKNSAQGSAAACPDIPSDFTFDNDNALGNLAEGAATFTITNLPVGNYFIETCTATFQCAFTPAGITNGVTTNVAVEIFVPGA